LLNKTFDNLAKTTSNRKCKRNRQKSESEEAATKYIFQEENHNEKSPSTIKEG
jgi:hypothetical protein